MKFEDIKVLLVEDDVSTRATIRAMLGEIGIHQVFESKDGLEADTFIGMDASEVDLVISDWNMPEKTGIEFLLNLRETRPDLPFIMITGRADANSVQDAVNAGVTSYLRKPFSANELLLKVQGIYKKYISM